MNPSNTQGSTPTKGSPYKLTEEQQKIYTWLKTQGLNVDDNTLNYWARKYQTQRLVDVVQFALTRRAQGQLIRNVGGWIHKLLKEDLPVVNDNCKGNRQFVEQFAKINQWNSLHIYEKYIKEEVTGDDLSLTMPQNDFKRALEAIYNRRQLYT